MWVRPLNRSTFTRLRGQMDYQGMCWPTGRCLHWHFQHVPDWVSNTNMFQADHHSPCAQHEGNLPKWLQTRSTHVRSHEVLWKAGNGSHQHQYSRNLRPTPICIPPKQIHRWCNLMQSDAIALHTALSHLDKINTYMRMLFIDYSSAFNTIVPLKLKSNQMLLVTYKW
jgi:hypothetical protein